jgi:recombination protein RecA
MGVEHGFVRKAGAWYTYEGDQLGQGKENARNFLKDNPDLANEIEKKIKEKLGVGVRPEEPAAEPGADAAVTTPAADDAAKSVPAPAAAKTAKTKAAAAKS